MNQATFGGRLRYARKEIKRESQKELAAAVGISPTNVSSWEGKESADVNADKLALAAKHLGVNLAWLLNGTGAPVTESSLADPDLVPVTSKEIPLITWDQLERYVTSTNPSREFKESPRVTVPASSPRQFALVLPSAINVSGIMKADDVVTCDPDGVVKHGKYLIYRFANNGVSVGEYVEFSPPRKSRVIESNGELAANFDQARVIATIESRLFL